MLRGYHHFMYKNGYDYVASPFLKLDFVKLSNKKSLDQLIIV